MTAPSACPICDGQLSLRRKGTASHLAADAFSPTYHQTGEHGDLYGCADCGTVPSDPCPNCAHCNDHCDCARCVGCGGATGSVCPNCRECAGCCDCISCRECGDPA